MLDNIVTTSPERTDGPTDESGWTADELSALLGGKWLNKPKEGWRAKSIAMYSYKPFLQGDDCMFVAMDRDTWVNGSKSTGFYAEWTDTHETLKTIHKQCCGAIVQRPVEGLPKDFPQFVVEDSYSVMPALAVEARRRMTGKIVAVTGTVGKSTTKNMLTSLLEPEGSVISTIESNNTRTGFAITLARCIANPDFAVVEVAQSALWMDKKGAAWRIRPHISIITEIGISQVGKLIQNEADTALVKARICNGIMPGGYAILNRDMDKFDLVADQVRNCGAKVLSYGFHPEADIRVSNHRADFKSSHVRVDFCGEEIEYHLELPGKAMVSNSMAALAAVKLLGLDVQTAARRLAHYRSVGKLESKALPLSSGGQAVMIDDNYSAETLSMKAAFEVASLYSAVPGARRIAVLGRIINLGDKAAEIHASLADSIIDAGFDKVFLHGEEMATLEKRLPESLNGGLFKDARSLAEAAVNCLSDGDLILVKGDVRGTDFRFMPELLAEAAKPKPKPLENGLSARILIDLESGEVLHAVNEVRQFSPLSLSQFLLTALCADLLLERKRLTADIRYTPRQLRLLRKGRSRPSADPPAGSGQAAIATGRGKG